MAGQLFTGLCCGGWGVFQLALLKSCLVCRRVPFWALYCSCFILMMSLRSWWELICLMVLFSFADDICLYVEIGCPGDFDLVQANLDAVFSSLCCKLMCFNASKCKYMLISRSPNKTLPTSEVELNGKAIE